MHVKLCNLTHLTEALLVIILLAPIWTFFARLICIMKSNGNAFYVNFVLIACNRQLIIVDADEKKNYFFATASWISRTSNYIGLLFPKKSVLAFFYSSKSISLMNYIMLSLIINYQITVKRWERPFPARRKLPIVLVCPA